MRPRSSVTAIICGLTLIILFSLRPATAEIFAESLDTPVTDSAADLSQSIPAIHPSQFEYWPLLYGQYDVQAFLEKMGSPLKDAKITTGEGGEVSFASEIERIGAQYHIHPQVLLTLLEIKAEKVTQLNTRPSELVPEIFSSEQNPEQKINVSTLQQLETITLSLRKHIDQHRQNAWQFNTSIHSIGEMALLQSLFDNTAEVYSSSVSSELLNMFVTQYTSWFGTLNSVSTMAATQDWNSVVTSLPYVKGAEQGKYNSGPHAWGNSGNVSTLSGLDFGITNNQILNVATGTLVSFGCSVPGGNTVSILIDDTDYLLSYWHLAEFSSQLRQKQPGDIIPLGFPIGTEGKTAGTWQGEGQNRRPVCSNQWDTHSHLELEKGTFNLSSNSISINGLNKATWDGKKLGPEWLFWTDTIASNRLVAGKRTDVGSTAFGYDGTAVKIGVETEVKQKVNPARGDLWSTVEKGYQAGAKNTVLDTGQYITSTNETKTDCTPAPCPSQSVSIQLPTDQAVLQAGPSNNPAKNIGPIRILVDKQFSTLSKNNFEVSIGNKSTTIRGTATLAGSYNIYEITIDPPAQPADGLYDLEVKVKGISATSPKSIKYGPVQGVSYVVLLDTSTSMNCSLNANPTSGCNNPAQDAKIYAARITSENFIRLLQSQESIGFIRFRPTSQVNESDGQPQLATTERKEYLSGILRNIVGDSGTPLYDAIKIAVSKLAGHPSPTKVVVVLSDGADSGSQSTLTSAIQAAQQAGVQVCTIRFGSAAVLDVLNRISKETGCVAAQSALNPDELEKVFTTIRTSVSGLQTVNTVSAVLQPGQTREYTFNIDQLAEATFQLVWQNLLLPPGTKLILQLIAPNGTQYTPTQLNGAEYISGVALSAFRVLQPLSGAWRLIVSTVPGTSIQAAQATNTGVPIEVSVTGNSDLKLRTYADSLVEAGNLLELGANVANPEPITGAKVLVSIERPSGSKVLLPLLDDGGHGDGLANDGYYSAAFYDTFQPGTYHLEYSVEGNLPSGTPFQRFGRRTVEVQGNAGLGIETFALNEGLNLVGLNGLAPTARTAKSALLSITGAYTGVLTYNYQDGGLGYFEDLPDEINTLKEIDPFQGYWIRTTKPVTLQVSGPSLSQDHYIPVHPGWNLVPYLTAATTPITEALSSIDGQYLGVRGYKNGAMSFWPQLPSSMNTLQVMEPGLGYWILMSNIHAILQYPAYYGGPPSDEDILSASIDTLEEQTLSATANRPQSAAGVSVSEQWMDLYSFDVKINGQPALPGNVVSIYDPRGHKVGEAVVQTPGWVGVLSVYGKSSFTNEIDGALPGDLLTFRINGELATGTDSSGKPITWLADGTLQQVVISGFGENLNLSNSLYLPLINR